MYYYSYIFCIIISFIICLIICLIIGIIICIITCIIICLFICIIICIIIFIILCIIIFIIICIIFYLYCCCYIVGKLITYYLPHKLVQICLNFLFDWLMKTFLCVSATFVTFAISLWVTFVKHLTGLPAVKVPAASSICLRTSKTLVLLIWNVHSRSRSSSNWISIYYLCSKTLTNFCTRNLHTLLLCMRVCLCAGVCACVGLGVENYHCILEGIAKVLNKHLAAQFALHRNTSAVCLSVCRSLCLSVCQSVGPSAS